MRLSRMAATALMALFPTVATAQLERYMGGGVGNDAPPREALVLPYHLDFTDRLCIADYGDLQARCVLDRVHKLASFAGRPVGIARDPSDGRLYVSTLKLAPTTPSRRRCVDAGRALGDRARRHHAGIAAPVRRGAVRRARSRRIPLVRGPAAQRDRSAATAVRADLHRRR